jgi:ribosome biogenesis protein BRX1
MVAEIAQSRSCNTTLFFEVRKRRDLFLWLARTGAGGAPGGAAAAAGGGTIVGPTIKFHVVNVHTMDELRLTGNCLKGSRPILSFDRSFDDEEGAPHLRLAREMLAEAFATPRGHPKSQPFHDHVLSFGWADGRIWARH